MILNNIILFKIIKDILKNDFLVVFLLKSINLTEMSSTNEILNRVLELCEEHMTEGEYLKSSKLLKTVSEKNPDTSNLTRTNRFIQPIRINIGSSVMLVTGYFARRHNIHTDFIMRKILFKINDHEIQASSELGFSDSFRDILKTIIKSEMAFDINIFNFFGIQDSLQSVKNFSFDNFREFFNELNDDVYGIELYYEYVDYVSKFISEYVSNIVREWKNEPIS